MSTSTPQTQVFVAVLTPEDQLRNDGTLSHTVILTIAAGSTPENTISDYAANCEPGSVLYTGDPGQLTQYKVSTVVNAVTPSS